MTSPGSQEPELREPDLPRTAKVGPRALRIGWTTGTCASAAAKAATTALRDQALQQRVEVALPGGRRVRFDVESCGYDLRQATAVVVKDAGDDPDVTHGAHLTATVRWRAEPGVALDGGEGIGVVTKPGLGIDVGEPAIAATPRAMIIPAVAEVVDPVAHGVLVMISVPGGEKMARKTTNARLGILGGISILGTTGIVRPFSTASWRASVEQAVSVMAAQAWRGRRSPGYSVRQLPAMAATFAIFRPAAPIARLNMPSGGTSVAADSSSTLIMATARPTYSAVVAARVVATTRGSCRDGSAKRVVSGVTAF